MILEPILTKPRINKLPKLVNDIGVGAFGNQR